PVDKKSLGKAALLEILRIVREVETPRPSARLSTIDTLPSVAANRGTEPAKLSRLMKGRFAHHPRHFGRGPIEASTCKSAAPFRVLSSAVLQPRPHSSWQAQQVQADVTHVIRGDSTAAPFKRLLDGVLPYFEPRYPRCFHRGPIQAGPAVCAQTHS